jgi:hypothetical protein
MRQSPVHWEDIAANSPRLPSDADVLEAAHHLVDVYLAVLREHEVTGCVLDACELPAARESFVNAFRVVIATENRPNVRALLVKTGLTLAQFQDNIGDPLAVQPEARPTGRSSASRNRADPARIRKINRAMLELGQEQLRLGHVFETAAKIAGGKLFHHA